MEKSQTNIRTTALTRTQIADLMRWVEGNQADVIALAVDRLHTAIATERKQALLELIWT